MATPTTFGSALNVETSTLIIDSGELNGRNFVEGEHQSSSSWYPLALIVGAVVIGGSIVGYKIYQSFNKPKAM